MSPLRSPWEEGREPGRQVVVLGAALALSAVAFDLVLAGRLTMFFDLSFIVLCLTLAVAVKPHDFFTVGVLPPLLMAGTFVMLGAVRPASVGVAGDGVLQATVSGLSHHSAALVVGYVLCLGTLAVRRRRLGLPLETGVVQHETWVEDTGAQERVPGADEDVLRDHPQAAPVVAGADRDPAPDRTSASAHRLG